MAGKPKMGAHQLLELLRVRHKDDVFVPECKDGPTWDRAHLRLDAWAMCKSWSPWRTIGYEIKVSRSDFEQDQKWTGYLDVCHQFYFVCPTGLIKAVDLPDHVGLIWASANAERLVTKRPARRGEPDVQRMTKLMAYVLMSRTQIVGDMYEAARPAEPAKDRLDVYREMVDRAEKRGALAEFVRGHIARRVDDAKVRELEAAQAIERAQRFADRLATLGIHWDPQVDRWVHEYRVDEEIDKLKSGLGEFGLSALEQARDKLDQAIQLVKPLYKRC